MKLLLVGGLFYGVCLIFIVYHIHNAVPDPMEELDNMLLHSEALKKANLYRERSRWN